MKDLRVNNLPITPTEYARAEQAVVPPSPQRTKISLPPKDCPTVLGDGLANMAK